MGSADAISIGSWACPVNLQTRRTGIWDRAPIYLSDLEKDQNFSDVAKTDNFQTICLYIKKTKNCFTQCKKKNSDTLIEKEQS